MWSPQPRLLKAASHKTCKGPGGRRSAIRGGHEPNNRLVSSPLQCPPTRGRGWSSRKDPHKAGSVGLREIRDEGRSGGSTVLYKESGRRNEEGKCLAGPETQEASWRRRMPELVLRTDRDDNEGGKGGLPGRGVIIPGTHCASTQALPPRRAPEPPHLPPTALAPLLWGLQVPISGDAPFPASQTKQDGLTAAPHLGAGPCLSP